MNDKLREALEALDTEEPAVQRMAACRAILREALAASKQEPKCDTPNYCKSVQRCTAMDSNMTSKQEPQAQAEPKVVAYRNTTDLYSIIGKYEKENNIFQYTDEFLEAHNEELITLQSHREAMAGWDVTKRRLESQASHAEQDAQKLRAHCIAYHEAIAKKDAALDACVEALENIRDDYPAHDGTRWTIDAAINKAKGATK